MAEDLDLCVVTFEQTREELTAVERRLAVKLDIRGNVRRELLRRDRLGQLVEDDLVADWHDLYASYDDWTRNENWAATAEPRAVLDEPPPRHVVEDAERAAEAAFSLLLTGGVRAWDTLYGYASSAWTAAISGALLSRIDRRCSCARTGGR